MKLKRSNQLSRLILLGLFLFCASGQLIAQDLQYTLLVIDSLTGPDKLGRGYVQKGHLKAAHFIANEMKEAGLKSFGEDYFQKFMLDVNTFPDTLHLSINGQPLQAGRDYQPFACNGQISGIFPVKYLKPAWLLHPAVLSKKIQKKKDADTYWVLPLMPENWDKEQSKQYSAVVNELESGSNLATGGFLVMQPKLTWEMNRELCPTPGFDIRADAVPEKIHSVSIGIDHLLLQDLQTQNVVGFIPGTKYPDSFVVFSAHYDHLGAMGPDVYIPGANDNASGVAMLLNLAHFLSQEDMRLPYSVAFIAFGGEELGLLGSKYFTEHPLFPLDKIRFLINMDMVGTGSEGITVVNGRVYKKAYQHLVDINNQRHYLPDIKSRGKAANSDHYFFSEAGVPAFFIYTRGGISAYHDIYDLPETLPLTAFMDLFNLLVDFVIDLP